jgi:hypothetical protein
MAGVHLMANRFLEESFSAKKVDLNGAEYTSLVDLMRTARAQGFGQIYQVWVVEQVVQVFLKDHRELYFFSTSD